MNMYVTLEFIINGIEDTNPFKDLLETYLSNEYLELRDKVIGKLNPNYDAWNDEFDKLYGEKEDYAACDEYNKFIAGKQDEILKTFDNSKDDQLIVMRSNPEDCDLIAHGKEGTIFNGVTVQLVLHQV